MKNKCLLNKCPSIQKGLTLIEMLVALTLGLFVIASILQIFASTKQAYLLEEQNSRLQENGRFALDFLSRYIRMAGYRENRPVTTDTRLPLPQDAAFPTAGVFTGGNGQVLAGSDNNDPNSNNISITFRYQGSSDGVIDCFGRQVLNNQMVTNTFFLAPTDSNNPANDMSLRCQSTISAPAGGAPGPSTQPLVPGIADMQILYGVQVNTGGGILEQYMNATNLNAQPNLWNNVVRVRIALLLQSDNSITTQPQTYRFPPWNTVNTTATDLRLRRVLSMTINIRNPKIGF